LASAKHFEHHQLTLVEGAFAFQRDVHVVGDGIAWYHHSAAAYGFLIHFHHDAVGRDYFQVLVLAAYPVFQYVLEFVRILAEFFLHVYQCFGVAAQGLFLCFGIQGIDALLVFGENPYELKNILKYWIRSKNEDLKVIPTDSIVMKVDKEAVRRSGMMIPGDSIPDYMHISLKGKRALYKSELMMLEMLAEANWERPIYIAVSVGPENQLNMGNHFIQEGLTYRFTPFDTDKLGVKIDSEKMYDNLMHKFKFGGIDKPGIYIDENAMRMCHSHRRIFSQLAQQLIREGKKDKAKAALDYAEKMIPAFNVPYDWQNGAVQMAEAYYQLGDSTKADDMMKALADKAVEYLTWYLSMDDNRFSISTREFEYHWAVLDAEVKIMRKYNSKLAEIYAPKVEELYNLYAERYERLQKMEKK
jgi:hypothetical protein